MNPQVEALRAGVDILVATPGRLLDHVQQKTVDLSRVEILVLDEADEMLNMGFQEDINSILSTTPEEKRERLGQTSHQNKPTDKIISILRTLGTSDFETKAFYHDHRRVDGRS